MDKIVHLLNCVSEASGGAKRPLLADAMMDEQFKWAMKQALDPAITFGIGKKTVKLVEKRENATGDAQISFGEMMRLADGLATRRFTGAQAIDALMQAKAKFTPDSWELIKRIALKDPRAGFTAKTLNEVHPDFIDVFEVNLAQKYAPKKVKRWPVAIELKHDGVRTVAFVDLNAGTAIFLSRTGKEFKSFQTMSADVVEFVKAGLRIDSGRVVLDGEVITGDFLKTVSEVRRSNFDAVDAEYHVFEFLTEAEFMSGCQLKEERRRGRLEALFARAEETLGENRMAATSVKLIGQEFAHNDAEVKAKFKEKFDLGFEGIIVKPLDGLYERRRTYGYMKIKDEVDTAGDVDLLITGVYEGNGKYEGMAGGVIVDFNGVPVRVGGGWSDHQRAEIWADYTNTVVEYTYLSWDEELDEMVTVTERVKPSGQSIIGRMIEVKYHEITPDGSMRHPRFARFRDLLEKGKKV
jgi:DNA ligase-1